MFSGNELSIFGLMAAILVLVVQFAWLYFQGRRRAAVRSNNKTYQYYIREKVKSILISPSEQIRREEVLQLKAYIGGKCENFDALSGVLFDQLANGENTEQQQSALFEIVEIIDPINFYTKLLRAGSVYDKAHACRMLADYGAQDQIKNIERHLNSRNAELSYNAAMALSKLGDENSVSKFVIGCKDNYRVSKRLMLQLLGEYNEDIKALASLIFRECDSYTKATVIKAIAKYGFEDFIDLYLESLRSQNATLRVAAVTALGYFPGPRFETELIKASNDKMWIVRNAAVKALSGAESQRALDAVVRATSDAEWWVRYSAAKTLVGMQGGLEGVEQVLKQFDTYASDAVKYVLYRDVLFE